MTLCRLLRWLALPLRLTLNAWRLHLELRAL